MTRWAGAVLALLAGLGALGWVFPSSVAALAAGTVSEPAVLRGAGWLLATALGGLLGLAIVVGRLRPGAIALVLTVALAGWLASRPIERMARGAPEADAAPAPRPSEPPRAAVRVIESRAVPVRPELVVNGRTEPARRVALRAETGGRVEATPAAEGALVARDQVLIRLAPRDRPAKLREARARLDQRWREYEAARRLGARQFRSPVQVAAALAELEATRAVLAEIELDLDRTTIRAPLAGVLERRPMEVGAYVEPGDEVAELIEQDPYLVVGDAPETDRARYRVGSPGTARLADGSAVEGTIRYVASEADAATRTYRVELEVANPGGRFPAGMSARIVIGEDPRPAHRVSAAALVLDDAGRIGVKRVDADGTVRFEPARIVRAEADAVWLGGLPERVRLITVGQGFVAAGQKVRAEVDSAGDGA